MLTHTIGTMQKKIVSLNNINIGCPSHYEWILNPDMRS